MNADMFNFIKFFYPQAHAPIQLRYFCSTITDKFCIFSTNGRLQCFSDKLGHVSLMTVLRTTWAKPLLADVSSRRVTRSMYTFCKCN